MANKDFEKILKKNKVKLDKDLVESLESTWAIDKRNVNINEMKTSYMEIYPDTVLPSKPKKKSKKNKKKKKQPDNTTDLLSNQKTLEEHTAINETVEEGILEPKETTDEIKMGQINDEINPAEDHQIEQVGNVIADRTDDIKEEKTKNIREGEIENLKEKKTEETDRIKIVQTEDKDDTMNETSRKVENTQTEMTELEGDFTQTDTV